MVNRLRSLLSSCHYVIMIFIILAENWKLLEFHFCYLNIAQLAKSAIFFPMGVLGLLI